MKRSLRTRLFLLLLITALAPLALVGVLIDLYLHGVHEDFGREKTRTAFKELVANLQGQEANIRSVTEGLARSDAVIAGLNLISRYQKPEDYRPLVFDEEKKALAHRLERVVATTPATHACIHQADGRLAALAYAGPSGEVGMLAILSFDGGDPQYLLRRAEGKWQPVSRAEIPHHVRFAPIPAPFGAQYKLREAHLIQSVARPVDLTPAQASIERVGSVRLGVAMTGEQVGQMAAAPDLRFAVTSRAGRRIMGPEDAPLPSDPVRPILLGEGMGEARMGEHYLTRTRAMPIQGGDVFHLSALYDKALLEEQTSAARWVVAGALLGAVLLVLPLSLLFFRRGIAHPLSKVLTGVAAFQRGDYDHRIPRLETDETDQLGQAMNRMAEEVSEREQSLKETEARLDYLAHHDPLTDLPNRLQLQDQLQEALEVGMRSDAHAAVFFLDLDRFTNINDSLGHPIGDELLQAVAARLRQALPMDGTLARVGGDEFLVVLPAVAGEHEAETVARQILVSLKEPFQVQGYVLQVDASIGISLYPADGKDAPILIRNADSAMFQAKAAGSNQFRFYTLALTEEADRKRRLEMDLRQALEQDQLHLVYHPQVELDTGEPLGMEALVRWRHPELGLVSPGEFIPLAEETHLILDLGKKVLNQACADFEAMRRAGFDSGRLAVNVSPIQVHHGDLIQEVREALERTGLPPSCLELEVTEAVLAGQSAPRTFHHLLELGIHLAIDDFGTGFSSLAYLKDLPVQRLKIDQSFVRDMLDDASDRAIVRSVVALGHSLSLSVLAEGVETDAIIDALLEEGCLEGQGFVYTKPLTCPEMEGWLEKMAGSP